MLLRRSKLTAIVVMLSCVRLAAAACDVDPAGTPCDDDGNPCSLDVCDDAGTCVHPAGGHAACDDGDPCTIDDTCGDGICAGTVVPGSCIDAALCYRTRNAEGFLRMPARFDDPIDLDSAYVAQPRDLCLSARTDGGAVLDPSVSLLAFKLRVLGIWPLQVWHVTDQFGAFDAELAAPDRLLVATATSASAPAPAAPARRTANHYTCRKVRAARGTSVPTDMPVTIEDAHGVYQAVVTRARRLCLPADVSAANSGQVHRRAALLCYGLRKPAITISIPVHTANELGIGAVQAVATRELCVPATAEAPVNPCLTSGDECGLPCCRAYDGQRPDCTYEPFIPTPRYLGCTGPTVLIDRTHANFHQVVPESDHHPGRYWGFAKQLVRDGYVVRDTLQPFPELLPTTTARVLVIANPRVLKGGEAISDADIAALLAWVEQGGSLLLSIDHSPFDLIDELLTALGIVHPSRDAPRYTFTRTAGTLLASAIADGSSPAETVDEVTTFTGTSFSVDPAPPPGMQYEPVLQFGTDAPNRVIGNLQGVAIQFGAGRIYVSGESGGLTAQTSFGMQFTPQNEQFLRNIIHWLDG